MLLDLKNIPAIFINLEQDLDKGTKTKQVLQQLGFSSIYRSAATLGHHVNWSINKWEDPAYASACTKSFISAFSLLEAPFIVFEDDILANGNINLIMDIPDDADVIYLGGSRIGIDSPEAVIGKPFVKSHNKSKYKNYYVPRGMLSAHAILVLNERAKEIIVNSFKNNPNMIQDMTLARLQFGSELNFYGIYPPMFCQEFEESTLNFTSLDD
jgi:hypothetical protein